MPVMLRLIPQNCIIQVGSDELEKVIKQDAVTVEALNLPEENLFSFRNLGQLNGISYDESPGEQGEDADSNATGSRRNSISPSMQEVSVIEPVPITLSSSPNSVLQETLALDAATPTSGEQSVYNDSRHLEETTMNGYEWSNNMHQESHTAQEEGQIIFF